MGSLFSKGSKTQKKPESRVTDQDRAILVGITQKGIQNNLKNLSPNLIIWNVFPLACVMVYRQSLNMLVQRIGSVENIQR